MNAGCVDERALLDAARGGDADAFTALVDPHRPELHAHCRRMLRCESDAEDACQEVLLRAWRSLSRFEGRCTVRSWLYRIATNASLNLIEKRATRDAVFTAVWNVDGVDMADDEGARPDMLFERRETASRALQVASELLSPKQQGALLMREVYGFTARESASILGTTEVSVNSSLQRARAKIETRIPS